MGHNRGAPNDSDNENRVIIKLIFKNKVHLFVTCLFFLYCVTLSATDRIGNSGSIET